MFDWLGGEYDWRNVLSMEDNAILEIRPTAEFKLNGKLGGCEIPDRRSK